MTCNDGCECHGTGIHVEVVAGEFSPDEIEAYRQRAIELVKKGELPDDTCRMTIEDAGDGEVKIGYYRECGTPIERIRRITGYLVGSLSRFNDAKKAEEHDRVKHLTKESYVKDSCPNKPCEACSFQESCDRK